MLYSLYALGNFRCNQPRYLKDKHPWLNYILHFLNDKEKLSKLRAWFTASDVQKHAALLQICDLNWRHFIVTIVIHTYNLINEFW